MNSPTFQTNAFVRGMNMDADISVLQNDQYRYAENIRLLSNDGGTTGVLQGVENIEKLATSYFGANEVIIGTASIREYGIVITKDFTDSVCYNRFWRFDFNTNIKIPTVTCILQGVFDIENRLSIVANYTSETDIKIYFADGNNLIRTVNIMDVRPYDPTFSIGSLDIIPSSLLFPFDVVGLSSGSLPSGTIQYCYQLFNMYGNESVISPLSALIPLSNSNLEDLYSYGQAPNKNSNKSVLLKVSLLNTGSFNKCRIISIQYTSNTAAPTISIVNEIEIGALDTVIYYEDKGNGYSSELTVEEFNALLGAQFAPTSIEKTSNRLFASNIKDLTWDVTNYDTRAYRANINGEIRLESTAEDPIIFSINSVDSQNIPSTYDCINPFNTLKTNVFNGTNQYAYKDSIGTVRGGVGKNISYELIHTELEVENLTLLNRFENYESATVTKYKVADSAELSVVSTTGNTLPILHTNSSAESMVYAPLAYPSKKNYSDPIIASKFKGYQRDEVYRFGIIFYNNKNIPSPVHWIGDIRMPHASYDPIFESSYEVTYNVSKKYTTKVRPLGIQFTVNNLPSEVKAYEIVRCRRTAGDRTVLMQGALSDTINYIGTADDKSCIRPFVHLSYSGRLNTSGNSTEDINEIQTLYKTPEYCTFTSPEICYNKENSLGLITTNTYLDTICGLASPVNKWRRVGTDASESSFKAIMHSESRIKNTGGTVIDVSTDSAFYLAGERYLLPDVTDITDTAPCLNVATGAQSVVISRYFYTFYTADLRIKAGDAINFTQVSRKNAAISDLAYGTPMLWSDGSIDENIVANGVPVGEKMYQNWSANYQIANTRSSQKYGPHGYCFIIYSPELNTVLPKIFQIDGDTTDLALQNYNRFYALSAIMIANIKQNIVQYGGNTYASIQNSVYITTHTHAISNINKVNCFGGDTYIDILDYMTTGIFSHADVSKDAKSKGYNGAYIPFESSINFAFKQDKSYSNTVPSNCGDLFLQNKAGQFLTYKVQELDPYTYNDSYSSQPGNKQYVAKGIYDVSNATYPNRIVYSEVKSGNNVIDPWTKFKFANYLDVDGQYGGITNLKVYNNKLYYWQSDAFGISSINAQVLVQDNNVGQLVLGTGGILDRYDYISTSFGNNIINDKSIVKSDSTIYWYDFNNNELVAYGNDIHSLSKVKSAQSYFNELPEIKRNNVTSYYDKKYNEVVFKLYDKSLVFNEQLQEFTCFYTIDPEWMLTFSNRFYSISNNKVYLHNTTDNLSEQTYPPYILDDGSYADINLSKIQFVVNKDYEYTKTFDNVFVNGDLLVPESEEVTDFNIIKNVHFKTRTQVTLPIDQSDMANRNDTYYFAINRENNNNAINNKYNNSFLGRMQGKYLICNYSFDCTQGKSFRIPSIRTTYRQSLI